MKFKNTFFLFAFTILLSSCTFAGYDRGKIATSLKGTGSYPTEEEIQKVITSISKLRFPLALALYVEPQKEPCFKGADFTVGDKVLISQIKKELFNNNLITDFILLTDPVVGGIHENSSGINEARMAAARSGADTLLFIKNACDIQTSGNWYTALYFTLVGAFLAPGTDYHTLYSMSGSMWDVESGTLYLTVETEATSATRGYIAQESKASLALNDSKRKAIKNIKTGILLNIFARAGMEYVEPVVEEPVIIEKLEEAAEPAAEEASKEETTESTEESMEAEAMEETTEATE